MNLMVVMGLRMRVLKSLLRLNLCLFKWLRKKSVSSQIEDFQKLVSNLAKEGDVLPEWFVAHGLAFKLLDSWKEYKPRYSHHKTYLNLQQTIVDIQIEETNRMSNIRNFLPTLML